MHSSALTAGLLLATSLFASGTAAAAVHSSKSVGHTTTAPAVEVVHTSSSSSVQTTSSKPASTKTTTKTATSRTATASASASAVSLDILSAFYRTSNVTVDARKNLAVNKTITFELPGVKTELGLNSSDYSSYSSTSFDILYQYTFSNGSTNTYILPWSSETETSFPWRVVVYPDHLIWEFPEDNGVEAAYYSIAPLEAVTKPSSADIEIVGMSFGASVVTAKDTYEELYEYAASGKNFTFEKLLNVETKSLGGAGAVWYKKDGVLEAIAAEQNQTVHF